MENYQIRSASKMEQTKAKAVGFGAFMVVLMLTVATVFTVIALNIPGKNNAPGDPVSAPIVFAVPVNGSYSIYKDFSATELQYNITLNRWEAHKAVDIAAVLGTPVLATYEGTVTSVVNNSLMGTTVTIEHKNGLKTVYSNLDSHVTVASGDYVDKGQRIGMVGATASSKKMDPPHVMVEVYRDSSKVNPHDYIDFSNK